MVLSNTYESLCIMTGRYNEIGFTLSHARIKSEHIKIEFTFIRFRIRYIYNIYKLINLLKW